MDFQLTEKELENIERVKNNKESSIVLFKEGEHYLLEFKVTDIEKAEYFISKLGIFSSREDKEQKDIIENTGIDFTKLYFKHPIDNVIKDLELLIEKLKYEIS